MNLLFRLLLLRLRLRKAPRVSLWDTVETSFRVLPNDLDYLRHMNNARYLALLDLGRYELLERSGYLAETTRRGWYSVVGAQTITYKRSLKLWQKFVVRTRLLGVDDRAAYLQQEFVRDGVVVARAIVQARMLRQGGGTIGREGMIEAATDPIPADRVLPDWVPAWAADTRISSSDRPAA